MLEGEEMAQCIALGMDAAQASLLSEFPVAPEVGAGTE